MLPNQFIEPRQVVVCVCQVSGALVSVDRVLDLAHIFEQCPKVKGGKDIVGFNLKCMLVVLWITFV